MNNLRANNKFLTNLFQADISNLSALTLWVSLITFVVLSIVSYLVGSLALFLSQFLVLIFGTFPFSLELTKEDDER